MEDKNLVLKTMEEYGVQKAQELQGKSKDMTGTELYEEDYAIPDFVNAVANKNMNEREIGFVCKSSEGRVVKLLQKYNSDTFKDEPEKLPAQWGFAWSTDPKKALPFISMATSPYMKNDCCSLEGVVYKSLIDSNVHSPKDYPQGWEEVK